MISHINSRFRKAFQKLPPPVREAARETYRLWKKNPQHSSLQFKTIHPTKPIYSVRIGIHWRAIGIREKETIIWFWIGSREEYTNLKKRL